MNELIGTITKPNRKGIITKTTYIASRKGIYKGVVSYPSINIDPNAVGLLLEDGISQFLTEDNNYFIQE